MNSFSVLVVEDDDCLRSVTAEWLRRDGYRVLLARSGREAMARATDGVDLVILDYRLPDVDGFEVLENLKRAQPQIEVVMLTGHFSVSHAVEAMKRGAFHYISKPVELSEIARVLEQAAGVVNARRALPQPQSRADDPVSALLGEAPSIRHVREMIRRLGANPNATVLISGESGTGKDLAARALHAASPRASRPFTNVNCTALPSNLLESELFGHERGAFTDAKGRHRGLFERSEGGTIFLDEIGDMDLALQAKLLHVLERKRFRRVGGTEDLEADVRVIAATNVDLPMAVHEARFRADLYYRLAVLILHMPSLVDRPGDVEILVRHFVDHFCAEAGSGSVFITEDAMQKLRDHAWPGNVRELRNVVQRALVLAEGPIDAECVQLVESPCQSATRFTLPVEGVDIRAIEKELLFQALERTGGNVTRAAKLLGMNRDQVRYRVQKFGLGVKDAAGPSEQPGS